MNKHLKTFEEHSVNEGLFSKNKNPEVEAIELKISDAAYRLKSFGTMAKTGAFVNGAKWAIHNLTDNEIKILRENTSEDDFSFFGL